MPCPFKVQFAGSLLHRCFEFKDQSVFLAIEHHLQPAYLLSILLLGDPKITGSVTLANAVQQAGSKPSPLIFVFIDIELAGAKLEDALQHVNCCPQASSTSKWTVKLRPTSW